MNRNLARDILIRVDELKCGEAIMIGDLAGEFKDIKKDEFVKIISSLAGRYMLNIEGKYAMDANKIDEYSKITGLERNGYEALDFIRNDKIWNATEELIKNNGYDNFSFFTALKIAKKVLKREIKRIVK